MYQYYIVNNEAILQEKIPDTVIVHIQVIILVTAIASSRHVAIFCPSDLISVHLTPTFCFFDAGRLGTSSSSVFPQCSKMLA
mmetsp:Transcript_31561/g.76191  ORF Transcript_31561/g.76191 Transcript_31561/m.76191 type:complete len:82 (-) Transcript_31561:6-251(-)